MKARFIKHSLQFKTPGGTSRGVLKIKNTWFLILEHQGKRGYGECGMFEGLSYDDVPQFEEKLQWICEHIHLGEKQLLAQLSEFPALFFGVEMAFASLRSKTGFELFPSAFTQKEQGITINGLIWMGDKNFMRKQITDKLNQGFHCIKLKIGAIDFQEELRLLKYIRSEFTASDVELRVDANGAFSPTEALEKLKRLSDYELHSIEQPIKAKQIEDMASLCAATPLPIALDEELIGVTQRPAKEELLKTIQPQYIILKPTLVGGFAGSSEWIEIAEQQNIKWWITSALESNVGLNAIAQFTYQLNNKMPQGLGTGSLFTNNIASPLYVKKDQLFYNPNQDWDLTLLS
ncbi:o-succinylbenzoate synthase [Mesonia sp. HuA40]|uniref:o-succinylbenzoate synthase n=1 Tax=Mesonia sp. HuA40 TaxID=2602761 RepID=UPI0011CB9AD9|nr:o-succinylbenzoate synthase [Mesonia sp. HuA40]TXK74224.1 o-succinylbenzoate synthase [Mesonia sp. HuA40]